MDEEKPLLDHVVELLTRLRRGVVAFIAVLGLQYLIPTRELRPLAFEAMRAVEHYLLEFSANPFKHLADRLGVGDVRVRVIAGGIFDTALASLYLASTVSLLATLPYTLYEIYVFMKPGLYPRERRIVKKYLVLFTLLFTVGCCYAYLILAPVTLIVMVWLTAMGGAEPILTVSDLFYTLLLIVISTGTAFSIPLLLVIPAKLGLITYEALKSRWRYVVLAILVVTAVITPDPTPISMLLLSIPLLLDYLVALALVKRA